MNLLSCTGVIPNCIPNLPVSIFFTIFDIPLHVKARLDTFPAGSITSDGTEDMAVEFDTMCGGFLFLGIFLGLLFLLATVLIIYYKQVSEGYEDQRRYQIMQQVGMSPGEVALSIRGADSAGIFPAAADSGTSYLSGISHDLPYFGAVQPV